MISIAMWAIGCVISVVLWILGCLIVLVGIVALVFLIVSPFAYVAHLVGEIRKAKSNESK